MGSGSGSASGSTGLSNKSNCSSFGSSGFLVSVFFGVSSNRSNCFSASSRVSVSVFGAVPKSTPAPNNSP